MKLRYIIPLLALLASTACINDKSDKGGGVISRIEFEGDFGDETYSCDRHDLFTLKCPDITQQGTEKPLTYRWEVNYEVVSTERDLEYPCPNLSKTEPFICRLIVSNEDGESWLDFKLRVTSALEIGVLVMSEYDNDTFFSFKREDKEDSEFILDVYNLNNPDFPLGSKPGAMTIFGSSALYIGTEEPARLMRVEPKTLVATGMIQYPVDKVDYMLKGSSNGVVFFADGRIIDLDTSQDAFMNATQQEIDLAYPGAYLEPMGIDGRNASGHSVVQLFYESIYGKILYSQGGAIDELADPEFDFSDGRSVTHMVSGRNGKDGLIITDENPGSKLYLRETDKADVTQGTIVNTLDISSTGINPGSVMLTLPDKYILFYTVDNKIYFLNYLSPNLEPVLVATVGGSGDVIKSMTHRIKAASGDDPAETTVYVAYDKPSGEYVGCVSAYKLSIDDLTWTLVWNKESVAGKIVDIIYKQ